MLISSVLSILGSPVVSRKGSPAGSEEKLPDVKPTESPPEPPAENLKEARRQTLASADILRPLLPELSMEPPGDAGGDYGKYLRALQNFTQPGKSHNVDIFE